MSIVADSFVVDMTPRSTKRFDLPGSEGEFYCVAAAFNTTGQTLHYYAALEGDGSVIVAMLLAGVIDFRLPGKDKDGNPLTLTWSPDFHSNRKVYEQLVTAPALRLWLTECVGEQNPQIYRTQTEAESSEAQAELLDKREELAELREEVGDDTLPLDPSASAGAPASSSEGRGKARASSTPSSAQP